MVVKQTTMHRSIWLHCGAKRSQGSPAFPNA